MDWDCELDFSGACDWHCALDFCDACYVSEDGAGCEHARQSYRRNSRRSGSHLNGRKSCVDDGAAGWAEENGRRRY